LEVKDAVQQEPGDEPVTEDIPVVGQGMVVPGVVIPGVVVPSVEDGIEVLGVRMPIGGLNPPVPSSVEPSGTPTRPTDDSEPIPVGDDADAAGDPERLLLAAAQVPDAVPAIPPPSKMVVEPDVPPEDEVIELPIPGDA
jgi:hypothetical protein